MSNTQAEDTALLMSMDLSVRRRIKEIVMQEMVNDAYFRSEMVRILIPEVVSKLTQMANERWRWS